MAKTEPMKMYVQDLLDACGNWLYIDDLPSPPATREMLQSSDAVLSKAIRALRDAYPNMIKID